MKALLKFENGAEDRLELHGEIVPHVIHFQPPEEANFYFEHVDDLPSGVMLYREITKEQVRQILREYGG